MMIPPKCTAAWEFPRACRASQYVFFTYNC